MKYLLRFTIGILFPLLLFSCNGKTPCEPEEKPDTFARGADLSWLTEMEADGVKFFNRKDEQKECMQLLRDMGMDAVRLRVWVNPEKGWNNAADVLKKAQRAKVLGLRIMIDFHYSDSWADPGKQIKPAAWDGYDFNQLCNALSEHTGSVLNQLKQNGIEPEWVQVGNETGNGMLWEEGRASVNMQKYATLNNAGYDAVKSVFPHAKVIVHLQNGYDKVLYRWLFDGLKTHGGKWDVIGMSLYPNSDNWKSLNNQCVANAKELIGRYSSEIMICEVGMPWDEAETSYMFLSDLKAKLKELDPAKCLGIFYWEPQAYGNWEGYTLGAFDRSGKPTVALSGLFGQ